MTNLVQRLSGLLGLVTAVFIAYLWVNDTADDRTLTILIAALGLFLTITIDIPAMIKHRRANGHSDN
jgi:cellobiose-specific phosphotransferase system component IIC